MGKRGTKLRQLKESFWEKQRKAGRLTYRCTVYEYIKAAGPINDGARPYTTAVVRSTLNPMSLHELARGRRGGDSRGVRRTSGRWSR